MREQVSRLADLVASLPRANRSRHRSSSRNRPPANTPPPTQDTLCWYHVKFGDDARKCRDPCRKTPRPDARGDRRSRPRFLFWAQFSRKLKVYEYSYLGPVLYMNIHITHDTKVFVTLREKKAMKYPFPVPSPNLNYNTKPLHHKQLRETMHTILPNVYRAYLV